MTSALPPGNGSLIYLTSCLIQVGLEAVATPPDTPNQYSAQLDLMSDAGDMNLDAVQGARGPAGQAQFALRPQTTVDDTLTSSAVVESPEELPTLTNTPEDIGKYWVLDEVDAQGHILAEFAYIWWGTYYRQIMMGVVGPPGPVPEVDLLTTLIPPTASAHVSASGSALYPTWDFYIPSPAGPPGAVQPLGDFVDFDQSTGPAINDLIGFTNAYTPDGDVVFAPFNIEQYVPQTWSMPASSFQAFNGITQQGFIGSFVLPPQPFPWTPIVWGHIGGFGVDLSADPLMIGCQVLLGNQTAGTLVGRGLGNTLGVVNIMPHYSHAGKNKNVGITPTNNIGVVPANHTGNQGTVYVNLYNDGQYGAYDFSPTNAQLFILVLPMLDNVITNANALAQADQGNG